MRIAINIVFIFLWITLLTHIFTNYQPENILPIKLIADETALLDNSTFLSTLWSLLKLLFLIAGFTGIVFWFFWIIFGFPIRICVMVSVVQFVKNPRYYLELWKAAKRGGYTEKLDKVNNDYK